MSPRVLPEDEIYPEEKWRAELEILNGEHLRQYSHSFGSYKLICPNLACNTLGFYAPRVNKKGTRGYRACKFCGLWQESWGETLNNRLNSYQGAPYFALHVICSECCDPDEDSWQLPWESKLKLCNTHPNEQKQVNKTALENSNHVYRSYKKCIDKEIAILVRMNEL